MPVTVSRAGECAHPVRPIGNDARKLLKHLGLPKGELSIVLCDDGFIQALNAQWRQKDEPTDVLSFAMGEGEDAGVSPDLLGDVVISVDTAARQAGEHGHPLETELRVLLVHGLLHLLGHDHLEPDDAAEMRAKEAELLVALGWDGHGLVGRAGTAEP